VRGDHDWTLHFKGKAPCLTKGVSFLKGLKENNFWDDKGGKEASVAYSNGALCRPTEGAFDQEDMGEKEQLRSERKLTNDSPTGCGAVKGKKST